MTKASRDLELLVAKIQQQLAPEAEVIHDVKLDGHLSKRKRQIDILVRQRIGQYEIQIIIDCKDYARPVDVKGVEEFYGLVSDVGAQKGVLVCPKGFSKAAKERAEGFQIDLYSPVDTDPHKWQVNVTIPALCDFRRAAMSFGLSISAPLPFEMSSHFYESNIVFDGDGNNLGTMLATASRKWNEGRFPTEQGEHENLSIFDAPVVVTDNGHGTLVPVTLYVSLTVRRQLYFGQFPIPRISGFKDEIRGGVIANAFHVGILDPEEIESGWQKINSEDEAPVKPVIGLTGLVGWVHQ